MIKLFYNGRFHSLDSENQIFDSILTENGKIIECFNSSPKIENIEKIDLLGKHVYPGFCDTHTHSFEGGLYSLSVNLENVTNLDEVFQLLEEATPIAGKVFAFHFDEMQIREKRFPTIQELDKIWPDIPLLLRRVDGHSCVINSKAAEMIEWKDRLPSDFNGYLYQRLNGKASNWFHRNLDEESILKAYHAAAKIAMNNGHTSIHTMIGDAYSDLKHYKLIRDHLNDFPIEFILYPQITDVKLAIENGAQRIGGCILADGSFGSHTAALKEPYNDNPKTTGSLYRSNEFWLQFIQEAHDNDLQVAIHCIGDRAIDQILTCYEHVEQIKPKGLKHAIIHNELTSDTMLDRMASAGVAAIMQPMFDFLWAGKDGLYEQRLGKERTLKTNRLKSIMQRDILLTGGSDWYITEVNALKGINAATKIHNPDERLTPYEAVQIYTSKTAELTSEGHIKGKLLPGFNADFVVIETDILKHKDIDKLTISSLFKNGEQIV